MALQPVGPKHCYIVTLSLVAVVILLSSRLLLHTRRHTHRRLAWTHEDIFVEVQPDWLSPDRRYWLEDYVGVPILKSFSAPPETRDNRKCPRKYPRLSMAQIASGNLPYLFGGNATDCQSCKQDVKHSRMCRWIGEGNNCWPGAAQVIINRYLQRQHESLLRLTPCDMWRFLRGRIIWLIGDTHMQDMMTGVACFMYEFWEDLEWRVEPPDDKHLAALLSDVHVPQCTHNMGAKICFIRADTLAPILQRVIPFLVAASGPADIMVLGSGYHNQEGYEGRVRSLASFYHVHKRSLPFMLWKDSPPDHRPPTPAEDWSGGQEAVGCVASGGGSVKLTDEGQLYAEHPEDWEGILRGGDLNAVVIPVMRDAYVPVIHTWNETVPMHDMHRYIGPGHECSHYCFPSAPEVWTWGLYATLLSNVDKLNAHIALAGAAAPSTMQY